VGPWVVVPGLGVAGEGNASTAPDCVCLVWNNNNNNHKRGSRIVVMLTGVAPKAEAQGNKDSIDGGGSWVKFSAKRLGAPFGAQPSAADRPRLRAPEVPPVRALPRGTDPTTTRHREGEPWCPLSEHPRWDPRGQGVRWTRPARRNKKWEEIFRRHRRLQAASNKEYIRGEAKQAYPGRFLRL